MQSTVAISLGLLITSTGTSAVLPHSRDASGPGGAHTAVVVHDVAPGDLIFSYEVAGPVEVTDRAGNGSVLSRGRIGPESIRLAVQILSFGC